MPAVSAFRNRDHARLKLRRMPGHPADVPQTRPDRFSSGFSSSSSQHTSRPPPQVVRIPADRIAEGKRQCIWNASGNAGERRHVTRPPPARYRPRIPAAAGKTPADVPFMSRLRKKQGIRVFFRRFPHFRFAFFVIGVILIFHSNRTPFSSCPLV